MCECHWSFCQCELFSLGVCNNFTFAKVSAVGAQYLPFGVSVLTAVAIAAVAGGKNIPLPFSISAVSDTPATEDAAERRRREVG